MLHLHRSYAVLLQHFRGIAIGVISYVAIQILSGKAKEKKISVIMYILAVLFILKYLLL